MIIKRKKNKSAAVESILFFSLNFFFYFFLLALMFSSLPRYFSLYICRHIYTYIYIYSHSLCLICWKVDVALLCTYTREFCWDKSNRRGRVSERKSRALAAAGVACIATRGCGKIPPLELARFLCLLQPPSPIGRVTHVVVLLYCRLQSR